MREKCVAKWIRTCYDCEYEHAHHFSGGGEVFDSQDIGDDQEENTHGGVPKQIVPKRPFFFGKRNVAIVSADTTCIK